MNKKNFLFSLIFSIVLLFTLLQFADSSPCPQVKYQKVKFIPGLTISSVSFKPEAPKQGDRIKIIVEVKNLNPSITYEKIKLEVKRNDKVIGRITISSLRPKKKTSRTIYYTLPKSLIGKVTFEVILNPPKGPKKLASVNVSSKPALIKPTKVIKKPVYKPKYKPKVKLIVVPNVVGMSLKEAKESVEGEGLKISVKEITQFDPRYKGKEGQVVDQTQKAGSKLLPGSLVEILFYNPKMPPKKPLYKPKVTVPVVPPKKPRIPPGPPITLPPLLNKPDLVITDVSFTPADPTTGDQVSIDIEIKNQGNAPAIFPAEATIWSATRPQGGDIGERLSQEQEMSIAPDETYHGECTFIEPWEVEAGVYTIGIEVDPENQVEESEEDNNEVTMTVPWITEFMADLSIESIYPQQHIQETEGTIQTFVIAVKNSGNALPQRIGPDTPPEDIRIILQYKRKGEVDWELFAEPRTGLINIGPGGTVHFSFSREALAALPVGDYLFRGVVDEWAVLRDRNFQNNILEEELSIAPSPIWGISFSPTRTVCGERIHVRIITTRDLLDPDHPVSVSVRYNDLEGVVENISKRSHQNYTLTVVVPEGATSGPISVSAYGVTGTSESSLTIFTPLPPTITEISPQACPVGSIIIIRGANFVRSSGDEGTWVEFASSGTAEGRREVRVSRISTTEIQLEVPYDALSGSITVKTVAYGQQFSVTSETPLRILPTIRAFAPNRGQVGDSVYILGTSFVPDTRVEFSGIQAEVLSSDLDSLEVRVPEGATTGRIRVITDGGSAESEEDFRVLTGPTIDSISPQSGPEGTVVTIEGEDLDLIRSASAHMSCGGRTWSRSLEIVGTASRNRAQLRIPTGINAPGIVEISVCLPPHYSNRIPFELTPEGMIFSAPQIKSFHPQRSVPGGIVILNVESKQLPCVSPEVVTIAFNEVPGDIERIIRRKVIIDEADPIGPIGYSYEIWAQIPEGATTGPITVTTYNVTGTSSSNISIFGPPTITEISPASGRAGEYITIRGTNFVTRSEGEGTYVSFYTAGGGSREVRPSVHSDTELEVRVPPQAFTGPLTIITIIARHSYSTTSEMVFTVER